MTRFEALIEKDRSWREQKQLAEKLKAQRNVLSREITALKKQKKDAQTKIDEAASIPSKIKAADAQRMKLEKETNDLLMRIPNLLANDVPTGKGEEDNAVIRTWGKRASYAFEPKSHVDLIADLDIADIPRAAKIAGARFYFLKNELVVLDMALQRMALDLLMKKGFVPVIPPLLMHRKPYEGVTDLKDFEDVMYKAEGEDLYLIATSEHPLAAMHGNEILDGNKLPLKYAGVSTCFRREAGAHGRDTKGIFRVHQFTKVEQFVYCKPADSPAILEDLLKNAETVFQKLEIPYRIVNICTGEIGTVATKKYDIEAWMPAQNAFREVVSASNCSSYQANRLSIRYRKDFQFEEKEAVHTLNATAVANPRAIVAILENHQNTDGSISIPKALQPYAGFKEIK